MAFLIIAYVAVGGIMAAIWQSRSGRRRVRDLGALKDKLAFESFSPEQDGAFVIGWSFLDQLSQGHERYAFNLLRGTHQGEQLFIFDHHFTIDQGKDSRERNGTMLLLVTNQSFPQLLIGPENIKLRITEAMGLADSIKLEPAKFSRKFSVRSPDEKFARAVCNARMIDYLLANPTLHFETRGACLFIAFEHQLAVEKIEITLQQLMKIRALLPEHLPTQTT